MQDLRTRLAAALGDRYAIESELSGGGMSTVFLAVERKHHRRVALKVIRPDLVAGVGTQRFIREIEIGARLQHPHILSLYDSGEVEGVLFYVMPYVEGESLRDRIRRERQLPIDEAVRIGCEVAEALDYAHEHGVTHRDIKPENILLASGHALVADFGVARALTTIDEARLTSTGLMIGTPLYMSPEQGDGAADPRSDIYSLGCVLYEMLVGDPPFSGSTTQALMARHATSPVPSIRAVRSAVPMSVEHVVLKALSKVPADRFTTSAELGQALVAARRSAGERRLVRTLDPQDQRAVAVLPFTHIGGDAEAESFSDGLTEELIAALTRSGGLRVASRTSSFAFKGKEVDARTLGERLNVATLVEGSVRREGNRIRIVAQVTRVADGLSSWSGTFERELDDVFALQEDLARAIVDQLAQTLTGAPSPPSVPRPTEDVRAYQAYWRGRYFWNLRTPQGFQKAIESYQEALARDESYALAYAGLADTYIALSQFQVLPPKQVFPKAEAAARRALELDPHLAEARTSLAHILEVYHWRWEDADAEYQRALELKPMYATAQAWYADYLLSVGRIEEAAESMSRAQALEPLSVAIDFQAATLLHRTRRFDEAIEELRKIVEMAPTFGFAYFFLGLAYSLRGSHAGAVSALRSALDALGGRSRSPLLGALGFVEGRAGRRQEAEAVLHQLEECARGEFVSAVFPAMVHLGLGEKSEALDWLEKAQEERSILMQWLRIEPFLDSVRGEPRFEHLVQRVHGK